MKIKNNPKDFLFLWINKILLKTNEDDLINPKTLLKTSGKTLVNGRNLALEILVENNQEMEYLYPHFKSARWQKKRPSWPSGRSANSQIFDRWACQSTARSTAPRTREQRLSGPVDRSVDRPSKLACVHVLGHVGRPVWSTDHWSGRPSRSTARAWQIWL